MDEISFRLGNSPGFSDGSAALRNNAGQSHASAHTHSHAAFVENLSVKINLGNRLGAGAARQPSYHWKRRVAIVPTLQPRLRIQVKRVGKNKPAIDLLGREARLLA